MASAETSVSVKTDSAGSPQRKKKFGLVLQGGGALGAYEAGAIECLYERGMECAIVAGASSGALNAVTLAAAKTYPPDALTPDRGQPRRRGQTLADAAPNHRRP